MFYRKKKRYTERKENTRKSMAVRMTKGGQDLTGLH